MIVRVKRIYEPLSVEDGYRVLVDRVWPRGMSKERAKIDLWAKDVAPSTELRKWFGHDPAKWEAFQERYREELSAGEALQPLCAALQGKDVVTLLYGAKDREHNQALVLRDVLKT